MSVYLFQRLRAADLLGRETLVHALLESMANKTSFVEALVQFDLAHAQIVAECVSGDGEQADASWRPDPRLLMDLPPGICERLLAFPFRERAGRVEVATVSPLEEAIRFELEFHLGRGVVLYRASVQALLAAAGASVDLKALNRVSQSAPDFDESPIPLVRKSQGKEKHRERTPTSPGLGKDVAESSLPPSEAAAAGTARPPTWVSPGADAEAALKQCRDLSELARTLTTVFPAPALVFEVREGALSLRSASGPGAYGKLTVSLLEESALATAAEEGNYLGPWYDCPCHTRFSTSYSQGTLVRIERIGEGEGALIVTLAGEFDAQRAASLLAPADQAWARIRERAQLLG